jgi:hypothetical protein
MSTDTGFYTIGSTVNGFGQRNSELDICFNDITWNGNWNTELNIYKRFLLVKWIRIRLYLTEDSRCFSKRKLNNYLFIYSYWSIFEMLS